MAIDGVPAITRYTSQTDDEGTVVSADGKDGMEDITKPSSDTDEANPFGAIVRVTDSGEAVWNDMSHCIVASPDGSLTICDRETGGDSNPVVNCVIKNNMITYNNPDPKGPEYLTAPLSPDGTELILSDGTTVFVMPQPDGTCDVTVTSVDTKVPKDGTDPTAGVMTTFTGLGSGKPFEEGKNPTGAELGGAEFVRKWNATHGDGNKYGTYTRLYVTPMTVPTPPKDYSPGRRLQGTDGASRYIDLNQQPGGISQRCDKGKGYEVDIPDKWKDQDRIIWVDLIGYDASKTPAEGAAEIKSKMPGGDQHDHRDNELNEQIATLKAMSGDADPRPQEILGKGDDGEPLFDTPTDPAAEASIFGDGTAGGSDDPNAPDAPDGDTSSSGGGGSNGLYSLSELFSSQLIRLLAEAKPDRRRPETTEPKES
jgi:hypothetical protein